MNELTRLLIEISKAVVKGTAASVDAVGEKGKTLIIKRTKAGKGVRNNTEVALKRLAEETIKRRKRTALASDTSPTKSNLTEKGRLLNSLDIKIKTKPGRTIIIIEPNTVKDRKKIRHHKNTGRNALDFTDRDDQELTNIVAKNIVKAINNIKIG